MLDVAIMIEGQDGLTWPRWRRLAGAVEGLGFAGLYRSDHYTNAGPPDKDSLELWVSLTWLASHTERIEFGPLVSPVSFRHPTMSARQAAALDDLSGGRMVFGMGAGWQEREHHNFGRPLLDVPERFARFEEALEVVTRLLRSDEPSSFEGRYYQLRDAILLPRPERPGGPPLLIGGNGPRRTLPLVARFADEWNAVYLPVEKFVERNARLDELLEAGGRDPASVRRSMMTGTVFARDDAALDARLAAMGRSLEELRARGLVAGTPSMVVDQIGEMAEAGIQRVMLQWLDQEDLDGLEILATSVLPQVGNL